MLNITVAVRARPRRSPCAPVHSDEGSDVGSRRTRGLDRFAFTRNQHIQDVRKLDRFDADYPYCL